MAIFQDPTTGIGAKVLSNQHITTKSIDEPLIGYKSRKEEQSFAIHTPYPWTIGTSARSCIVIKNTETEKNFVINKIFLSNTGGTGNLSHVLATMYKNTVIPTTNILGDAPIRFGNLNLNSSKVTGVQAYIWDGASTGLDGTKGDLTMNAWFPADFTPLDLSNSLVLGPSQIIRIDLTGQLSDHSCTISISGFLDDGVAM